MKECKAQFVVPPLGGSVWPHGMDPHPAIPPKGRDDEPWRPWLVRVAMNLSRDLLRRRKRRGYEGPWLPSPIETGDEFTPPSYEPVDEERNPAARYDMLESVSFAFLLALEALTPAQRAVLLLRDVFDYSVKETADALCMSEPVANHLAPAGHDSFDSIPSMAQDQFDLLLGAAAI